MTDNQKWLIGAVVTLLIQVSIVATAWGKMVTTLDLLQRQVDHLQQSCISKDVYQTDMRWIDAITDEYYKEVKGK